MNNKMVKKMNIYELFKHYNKNLALFNDERSISYGQLLSFIKANKKKLMERNYKKGDKVILQENDQMEFVILFFSLLSIGCWVVPVQSTITTDEYDKIVAELDAKDVSQEQLYLYEEKHSMEEVHSKEEMLQVDSENCGILHLTSGTTGKSKFCVRNLESMIAEGMSFQTTFSIREQERFMSLPPMSHSFALGAVVMAAMVSGSCICTTKKFMPAIALNDLEKYKVTFFVCVPFMAKMMLATRVKKQYDLKSVRVALVGAGAVTQEVYNGFHERFGICLMSNYGSTETGGLISRLTPQPYNSIGKPQDGIEIHILDKDLHEVKPGEIGELMVKSKGMFCGYYNNAEQVFSEDGLFDMGDLATYDMDGNIFLKGRRKWMINIAGKKVNPFEVEEVLKKYEGIEDCMVAGVERQEKEVMLVAFLTGQKVESSLLIEHCVKYLSSYKVPKRMIFLDEMPKNKSGKIARNTILEWYLQNSSLSEKE